MRARLRRLGRLATASALLVLIGSAGGVALPRAEAAGKCPVDHRHYALAVSAARDGSAVKVEARVGHTTCGLDGVGYRFGKHPVTLVVRKGANVKVLKNIMKTARPAKIPVAQLPHYVNRSAVKADSDIFRWAGRPTKVTSFVQVFIS